MEAFSISAFNLLKLKIQTTEKSICSTSKVLENHPNEKVWKNKSQVPKTSVNLDGDVREKFMCPPSLLTQGSRE